MNTCYDDEKKKPKKLKHLIPETLERLRRQRYSMQTYRFYEVIWKCLLDFAESRHEEWFSEKLTRDFIAETKIFRHALCKSWFRPERLKRAMFVLHANLLYGTHASRGPQITPRKPLPPFMERDVAAVSDYLLRKENYSFRSILGAREIRLREMLSHLHKSGVVRWNQVTVERVMECLDRFRSFHPNTRCNIASAFKRFFRVLYVLGRIPFALHEQMPMFRQRRGGIQSEIWSEDEVKRTLAAVDRGSIVGRRDYAMLLLFARMGLRTVDVRRLLLENIDWEAQILEFTQSKTGQPIRLPMPSDVASVLADYLRFGRPPSEHREVFLTGYAPYAPFGLCNNFHGEIQRWRLKAGLPVRRHAGAQALRHTLATQMLAAGNAPDVIAGALGHRSLDSTTVYFRYDVENLRAVALEPDEEARHA